MVRETVHCSLKTSADARAIWSVAREFATPWHPAIAWMEQEAQGSPRIIRRFGVTGEDTVYREELTYLSHSDMTFSYRALDGIEGANLYQARFAAEAARFGTTLTWQAEIEANPERVQQIANGTEQIFDTGLRALAKSKTVATPAETSAELCDTSHLTIGQNPTLALTVAPGRIQKAKTLCLFLHGIGGNRSNWQGQMTALGTLMPLAALDLRGYGDSTLGPDQSKLDDHFDDILAVMAHFGAEKLVLCGLSYGAWIGASFALRHPDNIAGLVLCGGCTGMSEADKKEREAFRTAREVPLNAGQTPANFADAVVDVIAGPDADADTRATLTASMAAIPSETYRDALTCFTNPPEKLDFAQADFPVLLMTGEHDRLAPPAEIRAVSQRFHQAGAPLVQFEVIAGAGHVCNLENPTLVNQHLVNFLKLFRSEPAAPLSKSAKREQKHTRIIDAALSEFSKNGFSGASMQEIARRAGVSKPTVYQYVGQKEDLFRAVLEQGRATLLAPFEHANEKDMLDVLVDFAWSYAGFVLDPDNLSIARLMIAEAERVPDIVKQFHETGPEQTLKGIARYLDAQATAGRLQLEDRHIAAEHLWALILSGPRNHALYFPQALPDNAALARSINHGLRTFLLAYASDPDAEVQRLKALMR